MDHSPIEPHCAAAIGGSVASLDVVRLAVASGGRTEGVLGFVAIHDHGGISMTQDQETTVEPSMTRSACERIHRFLVGSLVTSGDAPARMRP